MPEWDPEAIGSRFTMRPALLVPVGDVGGGVTVGEQVARATVEAEIGSWILEDNEGMGEARAVGSGLGRGFEGWAPVVEWILDNAIEGMAWGALVGTARKATQIVKKLRAKKKSFYVSRGYAALIALDHIVELTSPDRPLVVESVEEPTSIAGYPSQELNYTGIEPWIVILTDLEKRVRHILVVSPRGDVKDHLPTPMSDEEILYYPMSADHPRPQVQAGERSSLFRRLLGRVRG